MYIELGYFTFLALVLRTWKVRILFVARSKATASQSKINEVTPSLVTYYNRVSFVFESKKYESNLHPVCRSYLRQEVKNIGELRSRIFQVSTEDLDGSIGHFMDLSAFTVVLVLAGKFLALQTFQDLTNVLRGLSQHRLDGDA